MIIFILVIHAGGAKGRAVCAAENVFSPSSPAPPPSEWGSLLSSRGVASFQEWNPFRGTHFLGVWTYCEVSVMSGTESTEAGSSTQRNIKNLSEEDIKGANNQKASFLPSSNYKGGFWSFACGVMNRGRDEDCFTFLSFFLFFFFFSYAVVGARGFSHQAAHLVNSWVPVRVAQRWEEQEKCFSSPRKHCTSAFFVCVFHQVSALKNAC